MRKRVYSSDNKPETLKDQGFTIELLAVRLSLISFKCFGSSVG